MTDQRGLGVTSANGEEISFGASFAANYHKGLPHDVDGFVDTASYRAMVGALTANQPGALEGLPMGGNRRGAGTTTDPARYADPASHPLSSPARPLGYRKLTSPLTGHVYDTQGGDAGAFAIAAAPLVASDELAAEMAELYAMALLRDVPFTAIEDESGPNVAAVRQALDSMPWFDGSYTPTGDAERRRFETRGVINGGADLFRGSTPGSKAGPWVSQLMLVGNQPNPMFRFVKPDGTPASGNSSQPSFVGTAARFGREDGYVYYGTQVIDQRSIVAREGIDYLTNWGAWLDAQNGVDFNNFDRFRDRRRYLWTPRDIATYVHYDALYQAYQVACLLMLADPAFPKDRGMPETTSATRAAFASFGGPHILSLVTEVATRGLKAVWRQKWLHHRRMRPEVLAGLITLHANDPARLSNRNPALAQSVAAITGKIPPAILTMIAQHNQAQNASTELKQKASGLPADFPTIADTKNYLLPMAFPEGSPTHPAYGAGHATVAGACVTVLKAFFEMYAADGVTERPWPFTPFVASHTNANANEGGELVAAPGTPTITIQGELDKLAMNIANARNMAGVHYYTDYYESLRLGERITVSILEEQLSLYDEPVSMNFTSFDGDRIRIASNGDTASVRVTRDGNRISAADWYDRYSD
ncbi:hypothetical protein ACPVPU_02300 [Sphingomonas sp. CJ99]